MPFPCTVAAGPPPSFPARRGRRCGYTLIEMLTTVAALVIVLGLMVSLARHVRERAAAALSKDVLRRLDQLMTQYQSNHGGSLPAVTSFPPRPAPTTLPSSDLTHPSATRGAEKGSDRSKPASPRESAPTGNLPSNLSPEQKAMLETALANNRGFVAALKTATGLTGEPFGDVPVSMFNGDVLRDAWGSPIVFMPAMHPAVGTALQDRFFFFSAGPDRSYLTQRDNLYSYEVGGR